MADDQIKNTQPQNPGAVVGKTPETQQGGVDKFKKPSLLSMLSVFKKKDGKSVSEPKAIPVVKKSAMKLPAIFNAQKIKLESINKGLIAVLIGLIGLIIYITFRQGPEISSVISAISNMKFVEVEPKTIKSFKEIGHYLDQIKKRDIFSVFEEKKEPIKEIIKEEPEPPPPPPPPPKVSIKEKAKGLKLVGISWGENPKVIIQEISSQNMYFVNEGETIEGTEITVKQIMKEKVIIASDGEEGEL